MKFSIILNSRDRVDLLEQAIQSVYATTDMDNSELLISIDEDDQPTFKFLKGLNLPNFDWECVARGQSLKERLTRLALAGRGRYIHNINDDVIFQNPWDTVTYDMLSKYEDDIVYGLSPDSSCDKSYIEDYASFPIVSKKSVEILGYYMKPITSYGDDVLLYRIYKELGRVVNVPHYIRHVLHETIEQVLSPDKTAHEMRAGFHYFDYAGFDLTEDIEKLRKYINV